MPLADYVMRKHTRLSPLFCTASDEKLDGGGGGGGGERGGGMRLVMTASIPLSPEVLTTIDNVVLLFTTSFNVAIPTCGKLSMD